MVKKHPRHPTIFKVAVSGSAVNNCGSKAPKLAYEVGKEIAKRDFVLLSGATTGIPLHACHGAKDFGGVSIGLSPAISKKEHVKKYKLPTKWQDIIFYTGFGYSGRNLLLTRSADAVIFICGRIGTLNEFTNSFEDHRVIGVLQESGGTSELMDDIIEVAERGDKMIVYDKHPVKLVEKVAVILKKSDAWFTRELEKRRKRKQPIRKARRMSRTRVNEIKHSRRS
ncbi:MAG: hypothetical protein WCV86_02945 [Patescibacteria group bacterium]|jgi:hypothetical protein